MRLVIVTGMSGSGKITAINILEDAGYFCVDNLPVKLFDMFGIDVRANQPFTEVEQAIERLKAADIPVSILFMEASDETLLNRYKESRRLHPLAPDGRVEEGIAREREILKNIKASADYVIDTSHLLTRELKTKLVDIFVEDKHFSNLMVNIVSFGFKHGIPRDADLVFDVRFLPNPFYIEELKTMTGLDKSVRDYVMGFPEAGQFLDKLEDMLMFLIPNYIKEGKYQLVIAIGCTGGHHRSVTLAEELYNRIKDKGDFGIKLTHRDVSGVDKPQ